MPNRRACPPISGCVVRALAMLEPNGFVAIIGKSHRAGWIFTDRLRDQCCSMAVVPCSARADRRLDCPAWAGWGAAGRELPGIGASFRRDWSGRMLVILPAMA